MKKTFVFSLMILTLFLCSCTVKKAPIVRNIQLQQFMTKQQITDMILQETKIPNDKIVPNYIWLQYANIDEDTDLELLISYRNAIHSGYFFIYDYVNGAYAKVFYRPWAVEKMSMREIVNAEGNEKIHTLTANILQMKKGKVSVLWSGILDKYDYSKLISGVETHGQYYIDTNGVLNYFYKIDNTNQNGIPVKTEYKSEKYIWDLKKNMFVIKTYFH